MGSIPSQNKYSYGLEIVDPSLDVGITVKRFVNAPKIQKFINFCLNDSPIRDTYAMKNYHSSTKVCPKYNLLRELNACKCNVTQDNDVQVPATVT